MKSFPRKTYDIAIDYLCSVNNENTIIEPRNIMFNKKLDTYMKYTSINERSMHATYDIFFGFIENLNISSIEKGYKINDIKLKKETDD